MKIANLLVLLSISAAVSQLYPTNLASTRASRAPLDSQTLAVPRFEPDECAFPIPDPEKEKVRCGYLVVPENRTRSNSRPIRLPVIFQKSNSVTPAPDPILRTLGGPGASSLKIVRGRRSSPWLDHRDVVIFEQRGTALSQPSLDCPEVDAANLASNRANLDRSASTRNEIAAAKVCHDRLVNSGVDLSGYNSVESAADIEDLRRVLGYKQWNLYGVSYSARLMLEVMRDHPAGIRSVAIESVLPPSVNYDEVGVDGARRALKVVFTSAARRLLAGAGFPNGQGFPELEYLYNNADSLKQTAELCQQMWKRELNISIALVNVEWRVFLNRTRADRMEFNGLARMAQVANYADPYPFLELAFSGSPDNATGWHDPEFDRLMMASTTETNEIRRADVLHDAEQYMLDHEPLIPLYFEPNAFMCKPYVANLLPNLLDMHDWRGVYIDQSLTSAKLGL